MTRGRPSPICRRRSQRRKHHENSGQRSTPSRRLVAIAPAAIVNWSIRRLPCLTDAASYEEIEITMVAARPERAQEES